MIVFIAMENLRKRVKGMLVNNAKKYKKYVSRPRFLSHERFRLQWCRARDSFRSQIPVTTGGFQLRIS